MNSKTRFIPLVIIGAILLSLLAIVPAFGADEVSFIDPGDINDDDGSLSDSTPDEQEWARQGGRIGLMLEDDGLDTPIKRVLIPSVDARMVGTGDVDAHMATISDANVSGVRANDFLLIGMNTVRKVNSVVTEDGETTITVDKAFGSGMSNAMIYRINNSVTNLTSWDDNYSSYAMAVVITGANYRDRTGVTRYTAPHNILDSDIAKSVSGVSVSPADRISGSGTGAVNISDVLVLKVSGSTAVRINVATVAGDGIEMEDVPGATTSNPLGLGANETAYLAYWAEERNETGSVATVRSQAHQTALTAVLKETTPSSGEFVLEIMTVAPQMMDTDGNMVDVMPDFSATVPTLPVNPRDVVTLSGADSSGTITVETTKPVFSGFAPANNTSGKDDRPEVTAQITDGDSGLDKKNIKVIFRVTEDNSTSDITLVPNDDGDVDDISGGFEVRQRLEDKPGNEIVPDGDATIEWWVMASDEAGNVGYSDRQASVDGEANPCTADASTSPGGLAAAGCQPFKIVVDGSKPKLLMAETGRHWDSGLSTGDSDDKTEYRVSKADATSILVTFDEHLDDATVTASDFEVDGDNPVDVEVHNVKVRDDMFEMDADGNEDEDTGDGNSAIMGDGVQDVGQDRGYVFLTVEEMDPTAKPKVELVGDVSDIAGNRQNTGRDNEAADRIAPTLTVTITEGDRPVTKDKVNLTITSDENIGTPMVTYHMVMKSSDDAMVDETARRASSVVFKSATEYTAAISPSADGLYTVYVRAQDSSGGNEGSKGDNSGTIDVDGETSAILFERDKQISPPDFDPDKEGVNNSFSIDDPNAFIRIDFSAEGDEYDVSKNDAGDRVGKDLDTHGMVTIVSATLGDEDISESLQANEGGNIFLFHASGLELGEHTLSVTAMDEAGNKNASAFKGTITITERKPYSLALNPGWNLVSIPGEPMDTDINSVMADHPATQVLTYDPSVPGGWLTALRGEDGSFSGTLTNIMAGRAYWIETPTFQALKVDIPKQAVGVAVLPTISIVQGWNMIPILDVDGDFMLDEPTDDDNYFSGLSEGSVTAIYTFNTITGSWSSVDEEAVEIGKGYWVYATKAGVIVP